MKDKLKTNSNMPIKIYVYDILMCFSEALDLVNPLVAGHQIRVAYIASKLAKQYKLSKERTVKLVVAACIHDIGATTDKEKMELMKADFESNGKHEEVGYLYTSNSQFFKDISRIIRYHHRKWDFANAKFAKDGEVALESFLLHLADRIDARIDKSKYVLNQVDDIIADIKEKSGDWFMPELVDTFVELSKNESFWLYTVSNNVSEILKKEITFPKLELDINGLYDMSKWFSNIIDFRSRFTSVHSRGVATSAEALAEVMGFSVDNVKIIKIAGFFHDLGKLAVPNSILDKNGKLDKQEFSVIRSHTFHTYNVLRKIKGFENISKYAAYHHERLDKKGYPFHVGARQMSIEARLMAVADMFTAIAEDRPYRGAMEKSKIIEIIGPLGNDKYFDSKVVQAFVQNYDYIDSKRRKAQDTAQIEYENFWKQV